MKPWKILALGNPLKRDDAVALEVAERIPGVIKAYTTPENFVRKGDRIILIDALLFGGKPGETRVFKPGEIGELQSSTHNLSPLILELADEARIIGIQPYKVEPGEGLSEEMDSKLSGIASEVEKQIRTLTAFPCPC
jgi:hydrogenase maturation protease